ncbi:hypothetical protein C1645_810645 [Glomus cerebriforme]|uniref:Uncharacterized protein n=1 Tax=Glomus cerebriforme TaxID=658196 RepID=A0A397S7E9_9GLOM|nr:hypothetical protein C1645_810645 [Glomus cerebriforme]
MNKFFIIFLLLVVISKNLVLTQSTNDTTNDTTSVNDPVNNPQSQNCSTQDNSPCVKLNNILAPCNGAFGPPPNDVNSLEYSVDNGNLASCMCNQDAYDTLSSCVSTCFSNGNVNIKAADFPNYQRSCKDFGFPFGPPIPDQPSDTNNSASTAKRVLVGIFTSITLFIILGLLFWYWNSKKAKSLKKISKPPSVDDDDSAPDQMTVHHPTPGSGVSVSSLQNNSDPGSYYPQGRSGLFPPPGTIKHPRPPQQYSPSPPRLPPQQYSPAPPPPQQFSPAPPPPQQYAPAPPPPQQYAPAPPPPQQYSPVPPPQQQPYYNAPQFNNPRPPPPPAQQGYLPPQPQQPPYPPYQQPYSRPPPNRSPYQQQPRQPRTNSPGMDPAYPRNTSPPPNNYYNNNPNNYYGGRM